MSNSTLQDGRGNNNCREFNHVALDPLTTTTRVVPWLVRLFVLGTRLLSSTPDSKLTPQDLEKQYRHHLHSSWLSLYASPNSPSSHLLSMDSSCHSGHY